MDKPFIIVLLISISCLFAYVLYLILRSPYKYPYYYTYFDVSGKRNVDILDCLDDYLNNGGIILLKKAKESIDYWKNDCKHEIENSLIKKLRIKQYYKSLDDDHAFVFVCTRKQTRYHQANYQKTSYRVSVPCDSFSTDYYFLLNRNKQLENIDHATTLSKYASKSQRSLMTKELKQFIAERDNYTCQICGKYMPDSVGLQIDHIVPISKGGKSIPDNLQVLCSKCNGTKSNKL